MIPFADAILRALISAGARSAFILDDRGTLLAFQGLAPSTQVIWLPSRDALASGPVSTRSASGERLAFGAASDTEFVAAVFDSAVDDDRARALLRAALDQRVLH